MKPTLGPSIKKWIQRWLLGWEEVPDPESTTNERGLPTFGFDLAHGPRPRPKCTDSRIPQDLMPDPDAAALIARTRERLRTLDGVFSGTTKFTVGDWAVLSGYVDQLADAALEAATRGANPARCASCAAAAARSL